MPNAIPSRSMVGSQLSSSYKAMCSTSLLFQILHHTMRLVYGLTLTLICILHLTFINLHTCELQLHKEDTKGRRPKRLPYLPGWDMQDEGGVACVMFHLVSCRKTYTCAWDDINVNICVCEVRQNRVEMGIRLKMMIPVQMGDRALHCSADRDKQGLSLLQDWGLSGM